MPASLRRLDVFGRHELPSDEGSCEEIDDRPASLRSRYCKSLPVSTARVSKRLAPTSNCRIAVGNARRSVPRCDRALISNGLATQRGTERRPFPTQHQFFPSREGDSKCPKFTWCRFPAPSPPVGAKELTLFFSFPSPPFGGEGPGVRGQRDLLRSQFFHTFPVGEGGRRPDEGSNALLLLPFSLVLQSPISSRIPL